MHDLFHITPAITPRPMSALDYVSSDTLDGLPLWNICGYVLVVVITIPSSYMPHHRILTRHSTGVTSERGTVYTSGSPKLAVVFNGIRITQSLISCVVI